LPSPAWFIKGADTKKDKYISIPLPHGFRAFWSIGQVASDLVHQQIDVTEAYGRILDNITQIASPIDMTGFVDDEGNTTARPLVPTWYVPVFDITKNRDFAGRMVYKEMFTPTLEEVTPESQKGLRFTNPGLVKFTEQLNTLMSGNKDIPARYRYDKETGTVEDNSFPGANLFDINPAKLEHLIEGYTGGTGKFVNQSIKTLYNGIMIAAQQPEAEIDTRDVPVLNRLYRQHYDVTNLSSFYELKRRVGNAKYWGKKTDLDMGQVKKDDIFLKKINKDLKRMDKQIERTTDVIEKRKLMEAKSEYIIEQMKQYNANNE
jgi:hypothetical protein